MSIILYHFYNIIDKLIFVKKNNIIQIFRVPEETPPLTPPLTPLFTPPPPRDVYVLDPLTVPSCP
ncbi:hypothetical protein COTV021 [Cotia virus SPAn232]|uniref:Uncharacterized protein n=2 Tax=Cotia virus TaxID=39444 RepID=H6TAH4_9POXV|nr:hypothetical protein COTV021 [Cotia virus SPAn232]AFB76911.1 hypothetical protein COTV021 [Cotia virus SPAn232]AIT70636.1 hypothetical protein [Cotia virus]